MVKDRLPHFNQILQETQGASELSSLVDDDFFSYECSFSSTNSLNESTEKFLLQADIVQSRLRACEMLIGEMKVKQSNIIVKMDNDDSLEEDLDCLVNRIKDLTTSINVEIKLLEESLRTDEQSWSVEQRIKKCQVSSLQRVFQDVMSNYNKSQIEHRENCKKRIKRQLEICGKSKSEHEVEDMLELKDFTVFSSDITVDTQQMRHMLKMVESRRSDIIRLEKSLYELQDLFIEMAKNVESQGFLIDNIQHNVEIADECLRVTLPTLKAARRYKRRRFLFCCPCLQICQFCSIM